MGQYVSRCLIVFRETADLEPTQNTDLPKSMFDNVRECGVTAKTMTQDFLAAGAETGIARMVGKWVQKTGTSATP